MLEQVYASTNDGVQVALEASPDESLNTLKQKIQDIEGRPARRNVFLSYPELIVRQSSGVITRARSFRYEEKSPNLLSEFELLNPHIFLRVLEFTDIHGLAHLRCTKKRFGAFLNDKKIWTRCLQNQEPNTSIKKAARRIFNEFWRESEGGCFRGWLSVFSLRLQGYYCARRLWKCIVSTLPVETTCSFREPASEKELHLVEEYIGFRIPLEVRSSLMICDGQDVLGSRGGLINGLPLLSCAEIWNEMRWRPKMKENALLPITSAVGRKQICCTRDGKIVLLDGDQCHIKSESYFHFLGGLFLELRYPFWQEF
mmetsp:Transcript_28433/g.39566  ORF Transcript_28433/g.39566 Transcript_28433/m.39566 type:complete len:313 (+) Transcript_28433:165-1103(+)